MITPKDYQIRVLDLLREFLHACGKGVAPAIWKGHRKIGIRCGHGIGSVGG